MAGYTVIGREGYMGPSGNNGETVLVTTRVEVAYEADDGLVGYGAAASESEARADAKAHADQRRAERARKAEERKRREAEDPLVRLARLEAIVREAGLDG